MKKEIKDGDALPLFRLKDQHGLWVDMKDFIGKMPLVLYFYPKDDTPGCTKEACAFNDQVENFKAAGAEVFGISADSLESHKNFANKYKLDFRLLSDETNAIRKLFGVPADLLRLLPGRMTYVVDQTGIVIHTFKSQFNATRHVDEALWALQQIEISKE